MTNFDYKCRMIEEELQSFWPGWHVVGRLGGGTYGEVFQIYKVNSAGIRTESALKVIQVADNNLSDPTPPESVLTEIRIMEILRGAPNIVSIEDSYYLRDHDGSGLARLFIRMEYLRSFEDILRQSEEMLRSGLQPEQAFMTVSEICKLGIDICMALEYCEQCNIIHRDIKPSNLFIDRFGNYKVGDFGVSRQVDSIQAAHTMTGIGTISYMAPEIYMSGAYNHTVDIYALGLVLYQLLNYGRVPFLPDYKTALSTKNVDTANYKRLKGAKIPKISDLDNKLNGIILKTCAYRSEARYQTAAEFRSALEDYLLSEGISEGNEDRFVKPRNTRYIIALAAILAVVTGAVAFYTVRTNREAPHGSYSDHIGSGYDSVNQETYSENMPEEVSEGAIPDTVGNEDAVTNTPDVPNSGSLYDYNNDEATEKLVQNYYTNQEHDVILREINVNRVTAIKLNLYKDGDNRELEEGTDYKVEEKVAGGHYEYIYTIYAKNFEVEGEYSIIAISGDMAGITNSNRLSKNEEGVNEVPLNFAVDKTAPRIEVTGADLREIKFRESRITLEIRPVDNMNALTRFTVRVLDRNGNLLKPELLLEGKALVDYLDENEGKYTLTVDQNTSKQTIEIIAIDAAGNETKESYDVLVTPKLYYQYINLLFGVGGLVLAVAVVGGLLFLLIRKK